MREVRVIVRFRDTLLMDKRVSAVNAVAIAHAAARWNSDVPGAGVTVMVREVNP